MHDYRDLIHIFEKCFFATFNTRLVKGDDEPIYLPADANRSYHAIYFAHGFYASALHECAHWLVAGPERRQFIDFGYWYIPDGRTAEQQAAFQSLEIKPQAIEWILSTAAGFRFRISNDNLDGKTREEDTIAFKNAIHQQIAHYCTKGLPQRTKIFRDALCSFYGTSHNLLIEDFNKNCLR